jgi:acetylglutamate kinase
MSGANGAAAAGTTVVVKVGGANLQRNAYVDRLACHVAALRERGARVVLIHGGGSEISDLHARLGEPCRKEDGLRVTSDRGVDITTMVLCGLVNKRVVAAMVTQGVDAVGLSGIDAGLLRADFLDRRRFGRVGDAPRVDARRLRSLLDTGLVPVIAPVSLAPDGRPVNVNGDTAARAVATALRADRLDFVSDVPGIRRDPDADDIVPSLTVAEADRLLQDRAAISGGMRPKLGDAIAAVRGGVARVRVGNLAGVGAGRRR